MGHALFGHPFGGAMALGGMAVSNWGCTPENHNIAPLPFLHYKGLLSFPSNLTRD